MVCAFRFSKGQRGRVRSGSGVGQNPCPTPSFYEKRIPARSEIISQNVAHRGAPQQLSSFYLVATY
jgi:hypothetical protein